MASNTETKEEVQQRPLEVNTEGGPIVKSEPPATDQPWREWIEPVTEFLSKLPDYLGKFFSDYKQPLLTLALIVAGIVTVKITLAVLDAINDIPLLAPLFELVGLGYTGWFVYRYLLRSSTRGELVSEFDSLKTQVVGQNSQQS